MMFLAVYMFKIKNLHLKSEPEKARYHLGCIYTINLFVSGDRSPLTYHMFNIARAFQPQLSAGTGGAGQ